MTKRYVICAATLLASSVVFAQQKPNIVMIVADDMGYADCGPYGCKDIPTPNLDTLAKSGVRFTQGYVTGTVCSPSRAALMTGRYHYRDGVYDWVQPGKKGLDTEVPTIADYLKKAGYRTCLVGKWHLGEQDECNPLNRGFDEFYGFLGGGRSYFSKSKKGKDGAYQQIVRGKEPVMEFDYTTHLFGRDGAAFIEQHAGKNPFFLYLAFNAVHTPMEAPDDYLKRFESIENKGRRTYAAMLSAMDDAIGKVLEALKKAGVEENTLVCFISDNGGPITRNAPNHSSNNPLRGGKGETWEGGIRVPFIMKWPKGLPSGITYKNPVIHTDITATFLELSEQKMNEKFPMDGVSLLPYFKDVSKTRPVLFCWEYGQQWAIRKGNWKLVNASPTGKQGSACSTALYDLETDASEQQDRSAGNAERINELKTAWDSWKKDIMGGRPPSYSDRTNKATAP
ncbi:MAG: sulfatase-like hydrolase/transferase [bacterium]